MNEETKDERESESVGVNRPDLLAKLRKGEWHTVKYNILVSEDGNVYYHNVLTRPTKRRRCFWRKLY